MRCLTCEVKCPTAAARRYKSSSPERRRLPSWDDASPWLARTRWKRPCPAPGHQIQRPLCSPKLSSIERQWATATVRSREFGSLKGSHRSTHPPGRRRQRPLSLVYRSPSPSLTRAANGCNANDCGHSKPAGERQHPLQSCRLCGAAASLLGHRCNFSLSGRCPRPTAYARWPTAKLLRAKSHAISVA